VVGSEDAQVSHLICVIAQPGSAGFFETGLEHVAMSALDHAWADGQTQLVRMRLMPTSSIPAAGAFEPCFSCHPRSPGRGPAGRAEPD
jgi:hypothetical protein